MLPAFTEDTRDRELAMLMGMRPILKKAQWQGRDFDRSSLMAPIGYQTHLMVYGPGGYKFSDFVKVGVPLDIICGIVACLTLMPATLLTDQPLTLTNAPRLSDIRTMTANSCNPASGRRWY